ncbi:MAG TPA: ABC-F family ATP-binding cassette domain-containing protein [Actinomycetota bacterium]|nr:ABC-F family ATP-binding cassette domain-containing protein [Actinomycetota bacterium]
MSVVSLVGVQKSYGTWPVLQGVDFMVPDGARIGIIGPNGAGKSTLLRIVGGSEDVNEGEVVRRRGVTVSYLEQNPEGDDRTAEAWVLAGRPDIAALDSELREIEAELARPAVTADLAKMDRVLVKQQAGLDRWVEAGGPGLAGEARSLLVRLGFDDHDLTLPTIALSGGQRKLAAFAACLIRDPDLLLLDEPETYLDADKREILEDVVAEFPGAVVTVSHDRYLLDDTVNQIAELDRGAVTMWPGTYSAYAVAKELALQRQQRIWVTQQKEITRLEAAIARFELWASWVPNERHIRQARNKQRQIDQMDKVDRPVFERRKMALEMRPATRGGQRVVRLRDVTMAFDDDPVLLEVTFDVFRRERLGVVGPNGAGKTVLGQIVGELQPTSGELWVGPSVRIGYLAQGFVGQDPTLTPVETVRKTKAMYEGEAVALLAKFLFRYDQMRTPVGSLSGGERTRLELCLLMLSGANCLVLDEPTNHLDIESMEVLEGAVESFDGTAILISHDRYLLDRLCDRILEVRDGDVKSFEGGYDDWVAAKAAAV